MLTVWVSGSPILDAIPPSSVEATQIANDGEAGFGGFDIEDPGADVLTVGHKPVVIAETACSQPRLFTGWTSTRDMGRDPSGALIVADDRKHDVSIVDMNAAFGFEILRGADAKRPEETMDERLAWLLTRSELTDYVTDTGYVGIGYDSVMDAADYRGLTPNSVLDDILNRRMHDLCYFAFWDPAAEAVGLYFGSQANATTESPLSISNVLSDVDGVSVFEPNSAATLARKPDQVYSGVLLRYREGTRRIYRERQSTGETYVERSTTIDRPRTKKLATAQLQAEFFLTKHAVEIDTITCTIIVPPESAGLAVAGQRIDCKFSHLDGYEDWTSLRIVQSTVGPLDDTASRYAITLELENPTLGTTPASPCPDPTPSGTWGYLGSGTSTADGNVMYSKPGTDPPQYPTPSFAGGWNFPAYDTTGCGGDSADFAGDCAENGIRFAFSGPGTIVIETDRKDCEHQCNLVADLYAAPWASPTPPIETQSGGAGSTLTFIVAADGSCDHFIDLYDVGLCGCGSKWGFVKATWTAGEVDTEEDLAETPGSPVESTSDPTADDDVEAGYYVGQIWVNTNTGEAFVLVDNTAGAAVWISISSPALALDDLTDVNAPSPGDGEVLTWDDGAGEWVADALPAGVSPASTVEDETTWGITPAVGTDAEYARRDHTHGSPADPVTGAAISALGFVGELLISDSPSTPLVFADILQNESEDDLLYADL